VAAPSLSVDRRRPQGQPHPPAVTGATAISTDTPEHWIFDLDGTLTVAVHDFDAIRRALGLPDGKPILETLATFPAAEAERLTAELEVHEIELAQLARPQQGAPELLRCLSERGARLGIVTRNSHAVALETLRVCGLDGFFDDADASLISHQKKASLDEFRTNRIQIG